MTKTGLSCTLAAALIFSGLGCNGGDTSLSTGPEPNADNPTSQLLEYFKVAPYDVVACNRSDTRLQGRREIRLFASGSVDVVPNTQALQRYYRRHALEFFTKAPPVAVSQEYSLDTDEASIGIAMSKEFPSVNFDDPQILDTVMRQDPALYDRIITFVFNFMLRPIVEFARMHGNAGLAATNLVVMPQLVRPGGSKILPPGASLGGLAMTRALIETLESEEPQAAGMWKSLNLPAEFTPMMFLDAAGLSMGSKEDPALRDLVVAHEFGHAGGLTHRKMMTGNLMSPFAVAGISSCTDSLQDDQIATLQSTLRVGTLKQALKVSDDDHWNPGAGQNPTKRFPPARLHALLRGDAEAARELLAPLFGAH